MAEPVTVEKVVNGFIVEYYQQREDMLSRTMHFERRKNVYLSLEEVITFLKIHFEGRTVDEP